MASTLARVAHRLRPAALAAGALSVLASAPLAQGGGEGDGGEDVGRTFNDIWTYVLVNVEGEPITVRKVAIGTALLVLGYVAARLLSRLLRGFLSGRMKVSGGSAAALEAIVFYLLLAVFSFSSLSIAGVPLTAFTLLGGAAAIGLGFGSQTLVSNFISGLILLVERPIQVGNLVQIGDLYGTVEHIGLRSTMLRTGENVDIVVPNSAFLDQNIVNWTLTADEVRVHVGVGVVYGSPTERVAELMMQAVKEDEAALAAPEPFVLFTDFGDNSLNFEVHFWIRMRRVMDRRRTTSRIRFRIDALFREAGLVIAFPQRDVHLDTVAPLDVRLVGGGEGDA